MAKKNLASLMDGIMGDRDNAPTSPEHHSHTDSTVNDSGSAKPKEKEIGSNNSKEVRATFIVNDDLLRKLKYISLVEDKMQKTILNDALKAYIGYWEDVNGEISLPKRK